MKLNKTNGGVPRNLLPQIRQGGSPMIVRVDEILGKDVIRASLLIGSLDIKANQSVVIQTGQEVGAARSLTTAIAGSEKASKLVPADIIAFENVYDFDGQLYAEAIGTRTNDMMRGKVQVATAMAKPSKSVVNKKGALQSVIITDGRNAKTARSLDKVRDFMTWAGKLEGPGGTAGALIRDRGGRVIKEFFVEGRNTVASLLEDLEHDEAFASEDAVLELIPAWRLPMGRTQVIRDVGDPKKEADPQIGPFTRRFVSPDTKGFPGFLPCLVILCEEDQWEFGANTGKKAMVAAGVQPIDKLPAIGRDRLPTSVRDCKGTPNGINKLYDDETMLAMAKERQARCPDDPAQQAAKGPTAPKASTFMAGRRPQTNVAAKPQVKIPAATGPRRFGR